VQRGLGSVPQLRTLELEQKNDESSRVDVAATASSFIEGQDQFKTWLRSLLKAIRTFLCTFSCVRFGSFASDTNQWLEEQCSRPYIHDVDAKRVRDHAPHTWLCLFSLFSWRRSTLKQHL